MTSNYPGPERDYTVLVRCFTFNQSKYIEDALNGFVMQQTTFPFVCLIIDDASVAMRDGNGNLQGLSVTYMNRPEYDFAYLTYIALRPRVRGKGYSKKLLGTTMDLAKDYGFSSFRLEVNRQNGIAKHLYESFGFLPFDETDRSIYMKCML